MSKLGSQSQMEMKSKSMLKPDEHSQHIKILRAAALVGISSLALSADAITVFIASNLNQPEGDLAGSGEVFPPGLLFYGSATEVFMVLSGLTVSLMSLFFDLNVPTVTGCVAASSLFFGLFYMMIIAVAEPSFNWANEVGLPLPPAGGWATDFRTNVNFWLGYFLPFLGAYAMALPWHFLTLLNLYQCQQDATANDDPYVNKLIHLYFSFWVTVIGIGLLCTSAWTLIQEGPWLSQIVVYPPNIIFYPSVAVLTGVAVIAYGLVNILSAVLRIMDIEIKILTVFIMILSFGAYAYLIGFHVMMQIGLSHRDLGAAAAYLGIRIGLLLIPVVFAPVHYLTEVTRVMWTEKHMSQRHMEKYAA